ncbi:MAG TPA: hypothetical protein VM008_01070 [Phycisphaerae bacterium]|nr:hypothetical protein [Phycisphaerae bacterium]
MYVDCPYCRHRMRVKGARPGRFRPQCERCADHFLLTIPPDLDAPPMVMPIEAMRRSRQKEGSRAG